MRALAGYEHRTVEPPSLPALLTQEDIALVAGEFRRTGFRGGLNWNRAMRRSSELLAPWRGCPVRQPSHLLEGAGHSIQRERAQEVNRLLLDFLHGLSQREG